MKILHVITYLDSVHTKDIEHVLLDPLNRQIPNGSSSVSSSRFKV